jgi:hypothetical protein
MGFPLNDIPIFEQCSKIVKAQNKSPGGALRPGVYQISTPTAIDEIAVGKGGRPPRTFARTELRKV